MPAAAVIPAPIAYIKVVAVKKLVVEFLAQWRASQKERRTAVPSSRGRPRHSFVGVRTRVLYCEKN